MSISAALAALREELLQVQAVVLPRLRGLRDIYNDDISQAVKNILQPLIEVHQQYADRIAGALTALDRADAEGYPNLPMVVVPDDIMAELNREHEDILAAVSIFSTAGQAVGGTIIFPSPSPKS